MTIRPESIQRALAITSAFEGSGYDNVTGNFDGQGLSLGRFQRCWGQGSLQPMLREILADDGAASLVPSGARETLIKINAGPRERAVAWADGQTAKKGGKASQVVCEPWRSHFKRLLTSPAGTAVQDRLDAATVYKAAAVCADWQLSTERSLAAITDLVVQQGSIPGWVADLIRPQLRRLENEVDRLQIIVTVRASKARKQYVQDCLDRRMTIVRGRGRVHGKTYDLAAEFGLTDEPFEVQA